MFPNVWKTALMFKPNHYIFVAHISINKYFFQMISYKGTVYLYTTHIKRKKKNI